MIEQFWQKLNSLQPHFGLAGYTFNCTPDFPNMYTLNIGNLTNLESFWISVNQEEDSVKIEHFQSGAQNVWSEIQQDHFFKLVEQILLDGVYRIYVNGIRL